MNFKSSLVSFLLLIIMVFGISGTGMAQTENQLTNTTVVINEYELMKELSLKSKSELMEFGYNSKDIEKIKDYRQIYNEHLNELNELNDASLKNHGYTNQQIKTLRNYDESEGQAVVLAASLNLYSSPTLFKYDGNYTRGRLAYNWSWSGIPAFKMQDSVAASWNNWVVTSNTSYVSYYSVNTGAYYNQSAASFTQDGNGTIGAGHKFSVSKSDNYYYAKSGGGTFDLRSDTHSKKDFFYYLAYGHSQIWPTISFSVGKGGGAFSISFTKGVTISDYNNGSYILK